jgi:hypothetical protein
MRNWIPFFLLIITGFVSCQTEIKLDYPETQENLVLNSHIQAGDSLSIYLSSSLPYENLDSPPYLKNGRVRVFKDGLFLEEATVCKSFTLNTSSDTVYQYCIEHVALSGSEYELRASAPNLESIQGKTRVVSMPQISNVQSQNNRVSFTITDTPNESNFFFFELVEDDILEITLDTAINSAFSVPITTQDLTIEMLGFSDEITDLPTGENIGITGFLNDSFFANGAKTIDFGLEFIPLFASGMDTIRLRVASCSESYFEYKRSAILANQGNTNPFTEPYQVYSNVSNGYGVVGSSLDTIIHITP